LGTVQCKRVFQIPWSQSTFATFLILFRGVFWEGRREGKRGGGVERERGGTFVVPNVFLSNSQWVLNMFHKFPMRSPTCSQ
jgi:hypothetical protein